MAKYIAIEGKAEVKKAFEALKSKLHRGKKFNVVVGHQGDSYPRDIFWHNNYNIWTLASANQENGHFWIPFGWKKPKLRGSNDIVVEINPPKRGRNLRCGGLFVKDVQGNIFLAHTGKIGGGRAGIGKKAFRSYTRLANWENVDFKDGRKVEVVVIGNIAKPTLLSALSDYVSEVFLFKHSPKTEDTAKNNGDFTPESVFTKKYQINRTIAPERLHGIVVETLASHYEKNGNNVANDRNRDLFLLSGKKMTHLFEIKTDLSSTTLYCGVGQLLLNGKQLIDKPNLYLVVPGEPENNLNKILNGIGIQIVSYKWKSKKPVFRNLPNIS
jgi:hypothetical protein